MKITSVEVWPVSLRLRTPYTIAYESVSSVTNVFVAIRTDRGLIGFGAAAPSAPVTGESAGQVEKTLVDQATPLLIGEEAPRISWHVTRMEQHLPHSPSARAAVDMALHDLLGKQANLPVWQLLGGFRRSIRTSVTVGILPVEESVIESRRYVGEGFRILKLKGGQSMEADVERVMKVREAVGPRTEIRFDANQGYSAAEAIAFVERTAAADIEVLEQPTPRDDAVQLQQVTRAVPTRVMADESLMNLLDAYRLARRRLVDMVNIKLMKVGGIARALQIDAVAEAAELGVMTGCMDESALAISAGLQFSLSRRNVRYADLDGHLDLLDDPAAGTVTLRRGTLYPSGEPGLGWRGPA